MKNSREIKAVAKAIAMAGSKEWYDDGDEDSQGFCELAQAAIAASDSQYVKGLVEALKFYADNNNWKWNTKPTDSQFILDCGSEVQRDFGKMAREALQQLPEDRR